MARATRSTANANISDPLPNPTRNSKLKKRKRESTLDISDEQPSQKQQRSSPALPSAPILQNAGDVPLTKQDASKILDILEMIDTQGLLDRVFPLSAELSTQKQSFSFRALLKDSQEYPLRVLRSAVQQLFPISSHPRSRPSTPAAQQLRFCNLALSLLDQASFHSVTIPLDIQSILDDTPVQTTKSENVDDEDEIPRPKSPPFRKRKYALVQHLPTGDWWSSLNGDVTPTSGEGKQLKDLPTAHAELVAIIPSSAEVPASSPNIPKLGTYIRPPLSSAAKTVLPGQRVISCGKFLDYGPFTSFAPTFDQDGKEVGRWELGEVVLARENRIKAKEHLRGRRGRIQTANNHAEDDAMEVEETAPAKAQEEKVNVDETLEGLEGLLSAEDIATLKATLDSLELETAVQELLDRNARALKRLEILQFERLAKPGGGQSVVEEDSEEWETAQAITDSLAILTSLRPRSSTQTTDSAPLIPSASALRKLQRTLPAAPAPGWHGTLSMTRPSALRDDTTLRVPSKSSATVPVIPTNIASPIPSTPNAAIAPTSSLSYQGYTYNTNNPAFQSTYRPTPYAYKPGQASTYYPSYTAGQQQPQPGAQSGTPGASIYYGGQQTYTGQAYQPSWFGNYSSFTNNTAGTTPAANTNATASTSARGTPQPQMMASPIATSYGSFFGNGGAATVAAASNPGTPQPQTQYQPQRNMGAVANTIAGSKSYQGGQLPTLQLTPQQWSNPGAGTSQPIPPIPAHLRSHNGIGSVPGTPVQNGGTNGYGAAPQGGYYSPYPAQSTVSTPQ